MAITDNSISSAELANKGVTYLPDTPMLSRSEMQHKLDEIALDVLVPKHNGLISSLASEYASKSYVQQTLVNIGAGDMLKSVYDTDNDGTVDNAEKLGGELPAAYMTKAVYDTNNNGAVDIGAGGTGATTAAEARANLGVLAAKVVNALPVALEANTLYFVY